MLTSPADLDEVRDHMALHDWLLKHIRLLCKFANMTCRIGRDDSLYIVTGCIKSDCWALAAYKKHMKPPDHILRLERDDDEDQDSLYSWTERGQYAEARCSKVFPGGLKNQSLFLRGFKLGLSQEFYATLTPDSNTPRSDDSWGSFDSSGYQGGNAHQDHGPSDDSRGGNGGRKDGGGQGYSRTDSPNEAYELPEGVKIETFSEHHAKVCLVLTHLPSPADRVPRSLTTQARR